MIERYKKMKKKEKGCGFFLERPKAAHCVKRKALRFKN